MKKLFLLILLPCLLGGCNKIFEIPDEAKEQIEIAVEDYMYSRLYSRYVPLSFYNYSSTYANYEDSELCGLVYEDYYTSPFYTVTHSYETRNGYSYVDKFYINSYYEIIYVVEIE